MGLNPTTLNDFIGQKSVVRNLRTILESKKREELWERPIDHILLSGPAGLGKTALAEIISNEIGRPLIKLMGPHCSMESLSILNDVKLCSVVFIDEIHALSPKVEEALYDPMDNFQFRGREIMPFTLIGATTKEGALSKPLLSRFTIIERLVSYGAEEIEHIVMQKTLKLNIDIVAEAAKLIALRSKGNARLATNLLKRTAYYVAQDRVISRDIAQNCMDILRIDEYALDDTDRKILQTVQKNFGGGPVGVKSIATVANEDEETVEIRETYLVQSNFLERTSRGRILTREGAQYLSQAKWLP